MAKVTGIPMRIQVDTIDGTLRDISNQCTVSFNTPRGVQDVTGADKAGIERLLLLADGQVTFNGFGLDFVANRAHDVFKTVSSSSIVRTVTLDIGTTAGNPRLTMEMVLSDYAIARAQDGGYTWTAQAQLADGTAPTWGLVP